jgi:hypothetical protein
VNDDGGAKVIIANDPNSGLQVKINAATGQIINPPAGYTNINFQADAFRTLAVNQ